MTADQFYYKKFLEWQQKGNGDYRVYIKSVGRPEINREGKRQRLRKY